MATLGVVIRTLNEAELIGTCLETLRRQRLPSTWTCSSWTAARRTRRSSIARSQGARVFELPPGDFDYSRSLNVGIERVRGELVLILSAHAVPVDDDWVAAHGRAVRRPARGRAWRAGRRPGTTRPGARSLRLRAPVRPTRRESTPPGHAGEMVFSNAASCIRRSAWQRRSRSRCPPPRTSSGRGAWWRRAGRWSTSRPRPSTTRTARARVRRRSG